MLRALVATVFLMACSFAAAAPAVPASKKALAQQYFQVAGIDRMYADKKQIEQLIDMQLKMADKNAAQNAPPEKAAELHKAIEKIRPTLSASVTAALAKARPELLDVIAQAYSEAELKALIAFYGTPEGKSIVAKNPLVTAEMMRVSSRHMGAVMQDIQKSLMSSLQDSAASAKKAPAGK